MPNINVELAHPKGRLVFRYFKKSLLEIMLKFAPGLVDKIFYMQATERVLEYPFIHENIAFNGGSRILDVGSGVSLLPLELASKGYQVWVIDLRRVYHPSIKHTNLTFSQGDVRKTNFPDAFFNIVTAISSIEHIGLGSNHPDFDGDKDALREIARILKSGGNLLMTVPFGKRGIYFGRRLRMRRPDFRVYDFLSLRELLDKFEIKKMNFALLEEGSWRPASLEEAESVDSLSQPKWYTAQAVAMIVAKKPFVTEGS